VLLAATRRFFLLLAAAAALTAAVSIGVGLLIGSSVERSVSLGFYCFGSFLLVSGFFVGNRGPVRLKGEAGVAFLGSRFVRWATPAEREETINASALFVAVGFALILLGVLADTRYELV
jgi:hypothetical protein